jgi:hypothetical protein
MGMPTWTVECVQCGTLLAVTGDSRGTAGAPSVIVVQVDN